MISCPWGNSYFVKDIILLVISLKYTEITFYIEMTTNYRNNTKGCKTEKFYVPVSIF